MIKTTELIQDALVESFNEDFDITVIQDSLRRALVALYQSVDSTERQPLFDRYQSAFEAVEARNAKLDRFMPVEEVDAMQRQLNSLMTAEEQDQLVVSMNDSETT